MSGLVRDLRFAVRHFLGAPGFTAAVVLTLALGIGANAAIFSALYGVLLKPLPYARPGRLVVITELTTEGGRMSVAWPNFSDWRERARSFEGMAAFRSLLVTLTGVERPLRLDARHVTWDFLHVLGVRPQLGRDLTAGDDRPGAERVALVSDAFWRWHLGGGEGAVGRTIKLDGLDHTVIGVLPPGFQFLRPADVYLPFQQVMDQIPEFLDRGNHFGLFALARLRPGAAPEEAAGEMSALAGALEKEHPATNSGNGARVLRLGDALSEGIGLTLWVLMGAAGFVLLVACANVASLLLARGAARVREAAVRTSLGAGAARLFRQHLTESLLLALAGAAGALLLAHWGLDLILGLAPPGVPRLEDVRVDGPVLAFSLGLSFLTAILFGTLPALQAARSDLRSALQNAGRSAAAPGSGGLPRRILVGAEMALATVLLAGAGLMLRSVARLAAVDTGVRAEQVLTMAVNLPDRDYDLGRRRRFYGEIIEQVEALPGVASTALTSSLPLAGSNWNSVFIVGDKPVPPRANLPSAAFTPVTPGYFETIGIRLVRGRALADADRDGAPHVAVINQTFATRLWGREDPIGKRIKQGWPEGEQPWREVVGVVADVKVDGPQWEAPPQAYLPLDQEPVSGFALVVRTRGEPAGVALPVERALHGIDPDLPAFRVRTMEQVLDDSMARQRFATSLLASFAVLALTLAAIGVYGVISYGVAQRVPEIGVRMALGARPADVVRLVVRQGMAVALAGLLAGLAGALAVTRLMQGLLFGVGPADPGALAGASLVLALAAMGACLLPARRAARIDPVQALRAD